jgi:hypothetical protein
MLYREAGQFKSSYAQDQQIFPIRQDRIGVVLFLAFAFVVVPLVGDQYWLSAILTPFLIFALAALGLNILTGYAGQLSLGTAAFMAVGAFMAYNFVLRLPWLGIIPSFILAGLCAAAVGIVFGLPSLRIKGFYLAVATLACQFFVLWAIQRWGWITNHSASGVITAQKITILGYVVNTPAEKYVLTLAIVSVMALLAKNLMRSETGRAFMAVRDMDVAAAVCDQLVLLRGGRGALRLYLSRHGGARGVHARSELPGAVHDHHRRRRLHPRLVPRRGLHHSVSDLSQHRFRRDLARLRRRDLARAGVEPGADHIRRPDHFFPDRRAAGPRPAVADRQGEAAAMAVPALGRPE